jgi:peroxiredoxin Q/BCP
MPEKPQIGKMIGKKAPPFSLPDQTGKVRTLKEFLGHWVVLYFYPKDDTPGCTVEACSFRDQFAALKRSGAVVLGVSIDPVKKHMKFAEKYSLPFTLLSDEAKQIVERYGVWGKKKFMGREYMGTHRVSFLIDPKGKIAKIYDPVKPAGHAEAVLEDIRLLQH